ncbi:hypothetical protein Pyn_13039 [Prunus yedoensis var. nudiflora]|uniref:Uncharacterized protein n=1 Tax=Prunus yedoensis var. nudiflora TaxID=2094558 RepID=A0A314YUC4_PRUYE|nr:hypothetical protein Pyn_13039 [Prunus yedoensis var. nudiflora]
MLSWRDYVQGEPMQRLAGSSSPSTDTVAIWTTVRYSTNDAGSGTKCITFWGSTSGSSLDASPSDDSAGYKAMHVGSMLVGFPLWRMSRQLPHSLAKSWLPLEGILLAQYLNLQVMRW